MFYNSVEHCKYSDLRIMERYSSSSSRTLRSSGKLCFFEPDAEAASASAADVVGTRRAAEEVVASVELPRRLPGRKYL